jgi:hypothetical protein
MSEVELGPRNMIDCRWLYTANWQWDFSVQNFAHLLSSKILFLNNCFCDIVVQHNFSSEIKLKNYLILYAILSNNCNDYPKLNHSTDDVCSCGWVWVWVLLSSWITQLHPSQYTHIFPNHYVNDETINRSV